MSYAPGAPAPVWCLDIPPGTKLTLMALWSWADHDDQRECRACTVWTKAREGLTPGQALRGALAIQTCQTERAVRQHLTKLRSLGLADASGRCVTLTPAWRSCPLSVGPANTASDTTVSTRDTTASARANTASVGDTTASLQLNPPVPPSPLTPGEGDAPATPQPSVNGAPVGETPEARLARLRAANRRDFKPANLSPELWQVIEACGFEPNARCATWCTRMVEAMGPKGYRVPPDEQASWLRRVLEAYELDPQGRPRADALWDFAGRRWLASLVSTSAAAKPPGKFDGALGPKRRAKDFDGHGEVCDAAKVSWV